MYQRRVRTVDRQGGTFLHTSRTNPMQIKRKDLPEAVLYLEWIGGEFDPEAFDLDAVNKELRRLR